MPTCDVLLHHFREVLLYVSGYTVAYSVSYVLLELYTCDSSARLHWVCATFGAVHVWFQHEAALSVCYFWSCTRVIPARGCIECVLLLELYTCDSSTRLHWVCATFGAVHVWFQREATLSVCYFWSCTRVIPAWGYIECVLLLELYMCDSSTRLHWVCATFGAVHVWFQREATLSVCYFWSCTHVIPARDYIECVLVSHTSPNLRVTTIVQ